MRKSQYLYGSQFDATKLRHLTAEEYLNTKIRCSQVLVDLLNTQSNLTPSFCFDTLTIGVRDRFRINESLASQKHNRALIAELYGKDIQ